MINSILWIIMGMYLVYVDIVTGFEIRHLRKAILNSHELDGNVIVETGEHWYEVSQLSTLVGIVLIIGGIIGVVQNAKRQQNKG